MIVVFRATSKKPLYLLLLAIALALTAADLPPTPPSNASLSILIVGDSVVAGQGDLPTAHGIAGRLTNSGRSFSIAAVGLPGATSKGLSLYVNHQINQGGETDFVKKLEAADVILISAGMNDFWSETPPRRTATQLRTLAKVLKCAFPRPSKSPPVMGIATLIPTTLPAQTVWAAQVNASLMQIPPQELDVGPRFHQMDPKLLGVDGLHPSGEGYNWLANRTARFVETIVENARKAERPCSESELKAAKAAINTPGSITKRKKSRRPTVAAATQPAS